MDLCIVSLNMNCIMQLKQFYDIGTKVSSRKKCYYFWWSTWLIIGDSVNQHREYYIDTWLHQRETTGCKYPSTPRLMRRFCYTAVEVRVWISNYIQQKITNVITHLCPNFSKPILVKELLGRQIRLEYYTKPSLFFAYVGIHALAVLITLP